MQKWWILGAVVAALLLTGLSFGGLSSGMPVQATPVARATIREYIDEEAKTRLADTYEITTPLAGRVEAINLVERSSVSAGQVVARLVPSDLQLTVDAADAAVARLKASIEENDDISVEDTSLKQALKFVDSMTATVAAATARVIAGQAKLTYAEKNLARIKRAFETKATTQDELDQADLSYVQGQIDYRQDVLVQRAMEAMFAATALMPTAIENYIARKKGKSGDVLKKQLAEAEVNLKRVRQDQDRGEMKSPVDGVVLERLVSNEAYLSAGTLLLKIGRWEDLEVEADVLSQEVVRAKPGDVVEVSGPAIGPTPAKGTLARVNPAGFTKISSLGVEQQRVKVIVKFLPAELQRMRELQDLGVDYRVRVRIFTEEKTAALVVPRSALFRGPEGQWRVFAVRGGKAELQEVKLGLSNDEQAEVTAGLAEGEPVVLAPEISLTSGQAVKISENP